MTLQKDQPKPRQTRRQKIVMWTIYGTAAALLIAAIIVLVASGVRLF